MKYAFRDIEMKGDRVFVGDICYALDKDIYYDIWIDQLDVADGIICKDGEACSVVVSTAFGDGSYYDEHRNEFLVDAGVIGVTSSLYWKETPFLSGGMEVDVPSKVALVSIMYEDGRISINVRDKDSGKILYMGDIDT